MSERTVAAAAELQRMLAEAGLPAELEPGVGREMTGLRVEDPETGAVLTVRINEHFRERMQIEARTSQRAIRDYVVTTRKREDSLNLPKAVERIKEMFRDVCVAKAAYNTSTAEESRVQGICRHAEIVTNCIGVTSVHRRGGYGGSSIYVTLKDVPEDKLEGVLNAIKQALA